jgi:hypothetical protein
MRATSREPWPLATISVVLLLAARPAPAQEIGLEASKEKAGRFEKIEFRIRLDGDYRNPFDPEEVDVSLRVTTPGGATVTVPAFFCQDFQRRQIPRGNKKVDWLYPAGPPAWKARFAPVEIGRYSALAFCRDRRGARQSQPVGFEAAPSDRKGFVRLSKRDPRFLELDTGQPLFLIGENLAFIGESQYFNLAKAEETFPKLAANGANFLRIWVCCEDWATAIEAHKSAWGRGWEPKPPIVPLPGQESDSRARKCLKIPGEGGRALGAMPCHPLAVRPETRYVLSGKIRTEGGARVRLSAPTSGLSEVVLSGQAEDWVPFAREFTTGPEQLWLERITLCRQGEGSAWLDGLSLKEAAGGPELLGEADVNRPARGYYHPIDCFVVDRLVEAADRSGLYLQLCFITRNLYMGSLKDPKSPEYRQAIADARKLIRYVVARWGYATSVAAWEYFNEQDPGLPTDPFYAELGRYFHEIDVARHLRATSAWGPSPKDWRHPELDIAQPHHYLRPQSKEGFRDEVAVVLQQTRFVRNNTPANKPVLMAEFGLADDKWMLSPYMKEDRELVHFHNILWASALSGAAGTAQFWWWEQLDQQNAYRLCRPLARFLADVPFTTGGLKDVSATVSKDNVRPVGLQGIDRAYVWLFNPQATWWNLVVEKTTPDTIQGAILAIQGLASGTYKIQWWDTQEGKALKQTTGSPTAGVLRLEIPAFTRDVACKVVR